MVRAARHCTAVRFELARSPEWVLDCNCTLCRRYGGLWTYPEPGEVRIVQGADATDTYVWGDRMLAIHRCQECGCVTHLAALDTTPARIYGVNARMIPTLDPARVAVRQVDNGHTGRFWTRSAEPPRPSRHPVMPPPTPEDWR
jgi:hypothetical protein